MATAGDGRGAGPERAFLAPLPERGLVRLDADEARHLVRVRRVAVGDEVVLFDGEGGSRSARLLETGRGEACLEILGPYPDREPRRPVTVASAVPAAGRADDLVAALAELGVACWVPLACARSSADAAEVVARRAERFARLAREAAKVSGRSRLLRVERPRPPAEVVGVPGARPFGAPGIVLDTDPALPCLPGLLAGRADPPLLLVGPEGGFDPGELAALRAAGAAFASLGPCALRTELAAVAAAAIALATEPGAASEPGGASR